MSLLFFSSLYSSWHSLVGRILAAFSYCGNNDNPQDVPVHANCKGSISRRGWYIVLDFGGDVFIATVLGGKFAPVSRWQEC